MLTLRKEILEYITTCERIQGLLAQGAVLTRDEREVIEMCQMDLMAKLNARDRESYATGTDG